MLIREYIRMPRMFFNWLINSDIFHNFNSHVSFVKAFAYYHDAFLTPGISPLVAISLKHILHKPNVLINPLFRPQRKQRLTALVENFGVFLLLAITESFGIIVC